MTKLRYPVLMPALLLLLTLMLFLSLMIGKYPLSPRAVWTGLWDPGTAEADGLVIWQLRLPRAVAAALIGAALSAAGAAYQTMFRNPLVSPDILGVSAGAGLGAAFGIFLGLSLWWVQGLAFIGGLCAVALVYVIASAARRRDAILILVLAGVAIGAMLGAGISLLKLLADPYSQLPSITFWLMGGLHAITGNDLPWLAPGLLVALLPLFLLRWRTNLLSLPDDEARALGQHPMQLRSLMILAATLMTACAVSFSGIIGWVGLIIPHIARLLVGAEFSRLLPASLLLGASFLVATDLLARSIAPIELPLGLLTSLLGAPFFLMLLLKTREQS
ncbi:MAG: iron ABC transporter permease [Pigmentiphaga sp.]